MRDSFKTRTDAGGRQPVLRDLQPPGAPGPRPRPPALLAQDPAREPAALRGRRERHARGHRGAAQVGRQGGPEPRDRVHARARDHAGLHRRAGHRRPRRHARGDDPPRRQPAGDQPARARPNWSSTTRCRSTSTARPTRSRKNNAIEFARNGERYSFLRWGQTAFSNFKVVPPNTGIVHQVNLEHLARVVFADDKDGVQARLSRTRWSAPTRTRRWSTASACSAGASAASRPRPRCSASRSRC